LKRGSGEAGKRGSGEGSRLGKEAEESPQHRGGDFGLGLSNGFRCKMGILYPEEIEQEAGCRIIDNGRMGVVRMRQRSARQVRSPALRNSVQLAGSISEDC
jgi:hypothetical protein